jgi:hypothetical protein
MFRNAAAARLASCRPPRFAAVEHRTSGNERKAVRLDFVDKASTKTLSIAQSRRVRRASGTMTKRRFWPVFISIGRRLPNAPWLRFTRASTMSFLETQLSTKNDIPPPPPSPIPSSPSAILSLKQRIEAINAEIGSLIEARIESEAADCRHVANASLRQMLISELHSQSLETRTERIIRGPVQWFAW